LLFIKVNKTIIAVISAHARFDSVMPILLLGCVYTCYGPSAFYLSVVEQNIGVFAAPRAAAWASLPNTCAAPRASAWAPRSSSAAGIGLGTTIKYLRRTTSAAAGSGLGTTRKYLVNPSADAGSNWAKAHYTKAGHEIC
jgi:hypothetical protein